MRKQYRNEWKYICKEPQLAALSNRLSAVMELDAHAGPTGTYGIHSLYFDDLQNTCAKENEAGVSRRYKYRIRYYGDSPEHLTLERKEKWDGRCHKDSCPITREQYEALCSGQVEELLYEAVPRLLQEFAVEILARGFHPVEIVDYERVAFVEEITNIRITLDKNISVSEDVEEFLQGGYLQVPILRTGEHVLEVKFDEILPSHIRHQITDVCLVQSNFSKYYLGRKALAKI